jgi:hypothetical protein
MKKSRIASPIPHTETPLRHLPHVDLLVDTKTELLELALRSGLKVFTAMLEEDRTAICGPRHAHEPALRPTSMEPDTAGGANLDTSPSVSMMRAGSNMDSKVVPNSCRLRRGGHLIGSAAYREAKSGRREGVPASLAIRTFRDLMRAIAVRAFRHMRNATSCSALGTDPRRRA